MPNSVPYADPGAVCDAVLKHLAINYSAGDDVWRLDRPPRVRNMAWSTLYFLAATNGEKRYDLVAKIVHFPDQAAADTSWQSDELLARGQREFGSMTRVFQHFADSPAPYLRALRPETYLPELNAIVMDFVRGTLVYDRELTVASLMTTHGQRKAAQIMRRAGQWLRWLHHLPLGDVPPNRWRGPSDTFQALLDSANSLRAYGIDPQGWGSWKQTLAVLQQYQSADHERVWTHGDFHPNNLIVLSDGGILSFDTALEQVDSPYLDLAKLIVNLRTRRSRILSRCMIPRSDIVEMLIRGFLEGYFGRKPVNVLTLNLYEGRFLLEKWNESLSALRDSFPTKASALTTGVRNLAVNPSFTWLVQQWMDTVRRTTATQ